MAAADGADAAGPHLLFALLARVDAFDPQLLLALLAIFDGVVAVVDEIAGDGPADSDDVDVGGIVVVISHMRYNTNVIRY